MQIKKGFLLGYYILPRSIPHVASVRERIFSKMLKASTGLRPDNAKVETFLVIMKVTFW